MKKLALFCLCSAISISTFAQDLSITSTNSIELTKTSRNGRYGGTFIMGDEVKVLYVSGTNDDGAQIEQYDLKLSGGDASVAEKFISSDEAEKSFPWYMPQSKVDNLTSTNGKWLYAGAAFGSGMKLSRGHIQKNYTLGVYTGMQFVKEENIKPKAGDIWRIIPGGFKSLSDIDALATSNGFYRDLQKYGNPLLMPANSTLLAAGVITEKISLKKDQKYASNRVAVLTMNGMDFEDMKYETYILPYTALTISSGLGQDGHLCSLFGPLNGPTNLASLKPLYWKHNKNHFTLIRFDDERKLVDSVSFQSKLMWGDYSIINGQKSTFILAKGDAKFDGWYRGLVYKKLTGMQVVKVTDGKVKYAKLFTKEELEEKMVGPKGQKVKFDMFLHHNYFREVMDLPNGDALVYGYSPMQSYALQLSPTGDLKAFYYIPLYGKKDVTGIVNYQYVFKGDDLILVINQMPAEFTTVAQVSTSTSKGYYSSSTTTTVTKLNEVYLQSIVVRINTQEGTMSNALELTGKDFYPMGSFPAMFTENSVYFTGREKGPKGKVIHTVRIDF